VIAKALFDELIKRRALVTTLERVSSRVPKRRTARMWRFPIQVHASMGTRDLRDMTDNEISVDGEAILDGDDVTMNACLAAMPPTLARG
jgi:hypothetical protein